MKLKNIFLPILSGFWIFILLSSSGCTDEHEEYGVTNGKSATVTVDLLVPGASAGLKTRAMNSDQEKAIKNLQVLVFEEIAGNEVYRKIGEVTESTPSKVTLKLPIGKANYRFVVLANATPQTITDGASKQEVLNQFAFDCAGKWATTGDKSLIPMWGEHEQTISVEKDNSITILLHRSLARVDVGLKFKKQTQDSQTEEVEGLDNFKITSVRVYRTKNKAYVASSADTNNEVTAPNIPSDAEYNSNDGTKAYETTKEADEDPLLYEFAPTDSCVREIYIPESAVYETEKPNMDEVPCLVIGGYYGKDNTSKETFYRADFAKYNKQEGSATISEYLQVLRNHRYVFDIQSVSSPGFKEPDQALNSVNASMQLTVEEWNEVPLDYILQGKYFFQIDRRKVEFDAVKPEGKQLITTYIPFSTNIPLIKDPKAHELELPKYKNVTFSFVSSENPEFAKKLSAALTTQEFELDGSIIPANSIMIVYEEEEEDEEVNTEERNAVLTVTVENLKFTIEVYQKAVNVDYKLLCGSIEVQGKYREGIPLNYTHYLDAVIEPTLEGSTSTTDKFEKETVEIVSETRKGIYFEFKGTMNEGIADGRVTKNTDGTYTIKLQGHGTPVKDLNDPISPDTEEGIMTRIDNLEINTNSTEGSSCHTTIIFGYKTKRILAIGANAIYRYGYMLEPNTGSRAFVDASINFGVDPNSTVTMEQNEKGNAFTIDYMTAGRGMVGERIIKTYLEERINKFKPDIILTGQAINYFYNKKDSVNAIIDLIDKFVTDGGVFLMFNEYYPNAKSINSMVNKIMTGKISDKNGNNATTSYDNIVYKILGTDETDPILNGPFGYIKDKLWGSDGICVHGFSNVTEQNAIIYSKRENYENLPCIFRHKTKPFFFVGDGGFISNSKRYIGNSYRGSHVYCPFAINSAYQPVDRINYTNDKNKTVCNSRFFGNILAWAVDYAETKGINKK